MQKLAAHKNTCKHTLEYVVVEKKVADFIIFLLSHTKMLTSIADHYRAVLELLYSQNNIAFIVVPSLSPLTTNGMKSGYG